MHLKTAALLASAWLFWPGLALGQTVASGNEVTVNPVPGGGGMLLYPGGEYLRYVPSALQPGETAKDMGPIHLHMPIKRREAARRPEPAPTRTAAVEAPKPQRPPSASKPAAAAPQPAYNPGFGGFGAQGAAGLNLGAVAPAAPPTQTARANPPPPTVTTRPPSAATPGLSKRSVILFAPKATDPAQSALGALKFLAGDLNAAMTSAADRVELQAYGGDRGDKGSDARRLSLKRALAVRQALIDDGVPAERIDVRAMGGVDDSGPADRVDVYLKT
jgi:outer membrane protein OmpA-like peptidoglycan-associated protein